MASTSHADQVEQAEAVPTRRLRLVAGAALLIIAAAAAALSVMAVPAAAVTPGPLGTSQVPQGEPRYTVEVLHIRAIDESGPDWWGNDKVFGLFDSTRGYSTRTNAYDGVDTGDFVQLARGERCLTPQRVLSGGTIHGWLVAPETRWECDPRGVPGPIGLDLELWEDHDCHAFLGCFNPYVPPVRDPADDIIGRAEVTYTPGQLASRLPHVGDRFGETFTLGGPCGYQAPNHVCGEAGLATGPEYEVLVSIHRVSDAPLRATQE
jgi:hypothetical protein